jgi:hypothetical protein
MKANKLMAQFQVHREKKREIWGREDSDYSHQWKSNEFPVCYRSSLTNFSLVGLP